MRLNLGGDLSAYDGDDRTSPIAPDPHLSTKSVPRDGLAGRGAVLCVEFPRTSEEIAGKYWGQLGREPRFRSRWRADGVDLTQHPRSYLFPELQVLVFLPGQFGF